MHSSDSTRRSPLRRLRWLVAVGAALVGMGLFPAAAVAQIPNIPDDTNPPETPSTTTPPVNKGDESGLTVSPAIVDNTVDAGIGFVTQITLGNITQHAVPIEVSKGKLDTDQQPNVANQSKYDISNWFTVDAPSFLLTPQDRKTVNVTVNVPKDAEPGGHYATVYFGALAPSAGADSGETLLNARVGVVFLLTVRGDIHAGAKLAGPIETKTTQWDAGASTFRFGLSNTGNVHFQPGGSLVIKDLFGRTVKTLPMPVGYVLPGSTRKYELSWERGIRPGIYTAHVNVEAGITLQAQSRRFVIVPMVLVVPALAVLLVIVVGVLQHRGRKKRKARRDAALAVITSAEPDEIASDIATAHDETSRHRENNDIPPSPS